MQCDSLLLTDSFDKKIQIHFYQSLDQKMNLHFVKMIYVF